jgi:NAD(P)-dependent dehydrogenase (short-subunit alcohol dehydrogenase family)
MKIVHDQDSDDSWAERTDVSGYLDGKVIVVTGSARGIGREIALAAAAEGAKIVVADYGGDVNRRDGASAGPANAVAEEITSAGGQAVAVAEDVSTMEGGRNIVAAAVDSFGRLDGMVCNAGITVTKYIWEMEEREWDDVIATNLKGPFTCTQAAAKVMMPQGCGSIVYIGSGAMIGTPNMPSYAASKGGVLSLTWSSAYELQRYGINVNCVVPSAATRMSDSIYGDAQKLSENPGETVRSDLAANRFRDPANCAPIVVYLLGEAAKEINGQVFRSVGYEISRMNDFGFDRVMRNRGKFSVETIIEKLPERLGPNLKPMDIPFPERPR